MAENSASIKMSELMLDELEKMNQNLDRIAGVSKNDNRSAFGSIGMSGMKKRLAVGVAAGSFLAYTKSVIDAEANMSNLSQILDVSAVQLLKMEKAGRRFGTSFSNQLLNIKSTFAGLYQEDVSQLYENLAKYGFKEPTAIIENVQKGDTLGILQEIQKEWGNLSSNQQIRTGELLGFDTGMMAILNNPAKFQRFMGEINVTQKDIDQAVKTKEALDRFILNFEDILRNFVNGMLQGIDPLTQALLDADFPDLAKSSKELGKIIGTLIGMLAKLIPETEQPTEADQQTPKLLQSQELKDLRKLQGERTQLKDQLKNAYSPVKRRELEEQINQLNVKIDATQQKLHEQFPAVVSEKATPEKLSFSLPEGIKETDAYSNAESALWFFKKRYFPDMPTMGNYDNTTNTTNNQTSQTSQPQVIFSPQVNLTVAAGTSQDEQERWKAMADDWLKSQARAAKIGDLLQ